MLEDGIIRPFQSSYSTLVITLQKKEGTRHVCPDYKELNKLTIKDKFIIPIIHELLYELHEAVYFTKLEYLSSGYHQIRMKEEYIPKKHSEVMKVIMNFGSCLLALRMYLPHFKV